MKLKTALREFFRPRTIIDYQIDPIGTVLAVSGQFILSVLFLHAIMKYYA